MSSWPVVIQVSAAETCTGGKTTSKPAVSSTSSVARAPESSRYSENGSAHSTIILPAGAGDAFAAAPALAISPALAASDGVAIRARVRLLGPVRQQTRP